MASQQSTQRVTRIDLAQCANRRVGHDWNDPDNQSWERADEGQSGRQRIKRVQCVSRCTRCGSERVEPYGLDHRSFLADRERMFYRYSDEFKRRDVVSPGALDYQRIPDELLRAR